jgi:hypothetical protein
MVLLLSLQHPLLLQQMLLFDLGHTMNDHFIRGRGRLIRIVLQPLIDHLDDGRDLLFAVSVKQFAVATLSGLERLQVLDGVLVAVVSLFL